MKSNLCQHIKKDIIIIAVRIKPSDNYNYNQWLIKGQVYAPKIKKCLAPD